MPDEFQYDVFLSHSAKDKAVVRPLAERLKQAGLRVWFDEWNVRSGDIIALKVDEGLEQSPGAAAVHLRRMRSPRAGWPWSGAPPSIATPPMKAAASSRCCWPTAICSLVLKPSLETRVNWDSIILPTNDLKT